MNIISQTVIITRGCQHRRILCAIIKINCCPISCTLTHIACSIKCVMQIGLSQSDLLSLCYIIFRANMTWTFFKSEQQDVSLVFYMKKGVYMNFFGLVVTNCGASFTSQRTKEFQPLESFFDRMNPNKGRQKPIP